jgi:hypothetical protein
MATITSPTSALHHTGTTEAPVRARRTGRAAGRTGWALTVALVAFLLFDSFGKLSMNPYVVEACAQMGFPAATVPVIGGVLLLCVVLFVIPRTAVIGGVALSAYLGGAVCAQLRIEADLFSTMLFPVYFGVLVWVALLLRSRALRQLVKVGS